MSYVIETPRNPVLGLISQFIREATIILDESKPLPLRAAMVYKWSWVLHGLGYRDPLEHMDLSEEEIRRKAADMLKWVAMMIKSK